MESFQHDNQMEMLWPEIYPPPPIHQSAFVQYTGARSGSSMGKSNFLNSNKRMIGLLRAIWTADIRRRGTGSSHCYRHMIGERNRREKMRQSYTDLHSMLPPQTKRDKNSIVQTAASQLWNLQSQKEELQRRNDELEARLERETQNPEAAKIEWILNPSSAIDSMIAILNCLKSMELKATSIRSTSSGKEFRAAVEIQTEGVENALVEAERKFAFDFVEGAFHVPVECSNPWEGHMA